MLDGFGGALMSTIFIFIMAVGFRDRNGMCLEYKALLGGIGVTMVLLAVVFNCLLLSSLE